jgi:hypothetical protein
MPRQLSAIFGTLEDAMSCLTEKIRLPWGHVETANNSENSGEPAKLLLENHRGLFTASGSSLESTSYLVQQSFTELWTLCADDRHASLVCSWLQERCAF